MREPPSPSVPATLKSDDSLQKRWTLISQAIFGFNHPGNHPLFTHRCLQATAFVAAETAGIDKPKNLLAAELGKKPTMEPHDMVSMSVTCLKLNRLTESQRPGTLTACTNRSGQKGSSAQVRRRCNGISLGGVVDPCPQGSRFLARNDM